MIEYKIFGDNKLLDKMSKQVSKSPKYRMNLKEKKIRYNQKSKEKQSREKNKNI